MLLMACTSSLSQMNALDTTGGDFNNQLANNYKALANYEADEMYDWSDSALYARKSIATNAGRSLAIPW